jgi:hypothetical protein
VNPAYSSIKQVRETLLDSQTILRYVGGSQRRIGASKGQEAPCLRSVPYSELPQERTNVVLLPTSEWNELLFHLLH